MLRRSKKVFFHNSITRLGTVLRRVTRIKYLSVSWSEDMTLAHDTGHKPLFFRQVNSVFYKFILGRRDILYFSFKTYASPFRGINLWFDHELSKKNVLKISLVFHKAIQRISGMNVWESKSTCQEISENLINEMISKRILKYYFSIIQSQCHVLKRLVFFIYTPFHPKIKISAIQTKLKKVKIK